MGDSMPREVRGDCNEATEPTKLSESERDGRGGRQRFAKGRRVVQ